jgi:uncharacterized membrane protein YecN with MAPEG domain
MTMQTIALPVVSSITAGVLIIGQMALLFAVVRTRRQAKQSLGDGGDAKLIRAIRRHGNYAENAAIFVAGLALLEMMGALRLFVAGLATLFILGRILHAAGLSMEKAVNPWRAAGVFATIGAGVTLGVRLITLAIGHLS